MRGEIHDGAHVVVINNISRDVTVIQFRGYENGTLSGAWRVNYAVPAYRTQNLTGAAVAAGRTHRRYSQAAWRPC